MVVVKFWVFIGVGDDWEVVFEGDLVIFGC